MSLVLIIVLLVLLLVAAVPTTGRVLVGAGHTTAVGCSDSCS